MAKKERLFDIEKARERVKKGRRKNWWLRKGTKSRGFKYFDKDGKEITSEDSIERINSLVIPPAWAEVRICPSKSGKLQAVGIDAGGRVQYLYHEKFRRKQERKKFEKIETFGKFLPKIRKITNEHLELKGFPRERVLALMTRLLDQLYMRMGSAASVEKYRTYGITTLQHRHLKIGRGGKLTFDFVGKHKVKQRKVLVDSEIARMMRELKELKGPRKLFRYVDEDGKTRPVKPGDINRYLKEIASPEFSAKDFRTWGATLLAALELAEIGCCDDDKLLKKNVAEAVKRVAEQLGNTPAVCRGSYIHPVVLDQYQKGVTIEQFVPKTKRKIKKVKAEYEPEEKALMKLFAAGN